MRKIYTPSYENIFMDEFERKFIYPIIKTVHLCTSGYMRYLDDIFFIRTGNKTDLLKFLKQLNRKYRSIKFEYGVSKEKIYSWIPKYISKTTIHIPKYLERKHTAKLLTSIQSIQNRWKIASHIAMHYKQKESAQPRKILNQHS